MPRRRGITLVELLSPVRPAPARGGRSGIFRNRCPVPRAPSDWNVETVKRPPRGEAMRQRRNAEDEPKCSAPPPREAGVG